MALGSDLESFEDGEGSGRLVGHRGHHVLFCRHANLGVVPVPRGADARQWGATTEVFRFAPFAVSVEHGEPRSPLNEGAVAGLELANRGIECDAVGVQARHALIEERWRLRAVKVCGLARLFPPRGPSGGRRFDAGA